MSSILDDIIRSKQKEVSELKDTHPVDLLQEKGPYWNSPCRSLAAALADPAGTGLIAEFKRKSPSKGWFKGPDWTIADVLHAYIAHGAAGLSILTDQPFFGGDLTDLLQARSLSPIPLLRKDFIIDAWQIAEAKAYGADVILLIAACLQPQQVRDLAAYARTLGMEVLLELHAEEELSHICEETSIVGINNRDLSTFEVDVERSLRMARKIPPDKTLVAESGISTVEEVMRFREHGFKGFLMGERFMKETDPGTAFAAFADELKKEGK